ncbi:MAG TPA: vitamin K epoxide reductase family protein [Gaiellaceae bacterium]|nr:vitamin K epoxide reductase family protein [Gaiellaceae bacterium]
MTDRTLASTLAVAAGAGAAIAAYLTVVHYRGGVPVCVSGGCETVQRSRYAELSGVPVATLGLGTYVALLASSLTRRQLVLAGAAATALAGVVFAAYLVYVQLVVLDAVCVWCIASDALLVVAAAAATARVWRTIE